MALTVGILLIYAPVGLRLSFSLYEAMPIFAFLVELYAYYKYRSYVKHGGNMAEYHQKIDAISQINRDLFGLTIPIPIIGTVVSLLFAVSDSFESAAISMIVTIIVWRIAVFYGKRKLKAYYNPK